MTWPLVMLGVGALLARAWRQRAGRKQRIDPATYQVMADLYAIRRRLDVGLFKLRLSGDIAEARRQLSNELDELNAERSPEQP